MENDLMRDAPSWAYMVRPKMHITLLPNIIVAKSN